MSLLLAPATRENLEKSIERSVALPYVEKYLPISFIDEIINYSGLEGIRCWAMTKNKLSIFNRIQKGDEVLLTERKTGKFTHYGVVVGKTQNLEFGNALWPIVGDAPWEYVYFLANVTKVQIDKASLVEELGYANNFTIPGVIMVREGDYNILGTISKRFDIPVFDNVAETNVEKDFSAENIQSVGTRRAGHSKFSKDIKENYGYKCAICGITEPEFLIAGHISAWSEDSSNRLNPQNGICFCPLHDRAFEHGYISVNENFEIILNPRIASNSFLYALLSEFQGRKMSLPETNYPDKELLRKHRSKHKLGEYGN